jgi:hypothetical protein
VDGRVELRGERPLDLGRVRPRVDPASFRANLDAAARYCAAQRIRLVLLLLHDNPAETSDLERGIALLRDRRSDEARPLFESTIARGGNFSDAARLALARLEEENGRADDARRARLSPRTFLSLSGGYPIVADGDYRRLAIDVARDRSLTALDAGAEIDLHPEWYFDSCHFRAPAHARVAALLAPLLAQDLPREASMPR